MNLLGWIVAILVPLYIAFGFFLGWCLGGLSSSTPTFWEKLKFALIWPMMFFGG